MNTVTLVLTVVVAVLAVIFYVYRSIRVVPQGTAAVIERFGRYHRTLGPGLCFLAPGIDRVRSTTDMREQVLPFPPQGVITKDKLLVYIDWVVYFKVIDPRRATYEVENFVQAIEYLVSNKLSSIIADMYYEETITRRAEVNRLLFDELVGDARRWGIRVSRVDLRSIGSPPTDLAHGSAAAPQIRLTARARKQATKSADIGPEAAILGSIVVAALVGLSATAYGRALDGAALIICMILFLLLFHQARRQRTLVPEREVTIGSGDAVVVATKVDSTGGQVWMAGHALPARSHTSSAVYEPGTKVHITSIDDDVVVVSQLTGT